MNTSKLLSSLRAPVEPARARACLYRRSLPAILFAVLFSALASAQQPRLELFGGYSYVRFQSKTFGFSSDSALNGFDVMAAWNLVPGFGVVGEASGNYTHNMNFREVVFGPQFLYRRGNALFFAHPLFGRGESSLRVGNPAEDSGNTFRLGGGMDYTVHSRFAVRVFQVDLSHTHFFGQNQNNLRLSTGIVYRWGVLKEHKPKGPSAP